MAIYPPKPTSAGKATMIPLGSVQVSNGGGGNGGNTGTITITNPPASASIGEVLSLAGTVSPNGAAVQVGLSTSSSAAPSSWTAATVNGAAWTASITASAAGTYYIWAQQTATPTISAVSAALTVAAAAAALSYNLISGSGNGGLSAATIVAGSTQSNWSSSMTTGGENYDPSITITGGTTEVKSQIFWWDTSATNTTKGEVFTNSAGESAGQCFYYLASVYSPPQGLPAVPAAGTYYAKYASYDASDNLLGVIASSAITVTG